MIQNPEAMAHSVTFAPCENGTVSVDEVVIWQQHDYVVRALAAKTYRAVAHIVNNELDIEASVPCSLLKLKQLTSPDIRGLGVLPNNAVDIVQLAYSIVKENLLHLEGRHKSRPHEDFDVMEFRPAFHGAFGFDDNRSESTYCLEAGHTSKWDSIFGERWDIVVRETYVVTRIVFKREKMKAPVAAIDKLRCKLDLINFSAGLNYRAHVLRRLTDKYRLVTSVHSDPSSADSSSPDSNVVV